MTSLPYEILTIIAGFVRTILQHWTTYIYGRGIFHRTTDSPLSTDIASQTSEQSLPDLQNMERHRPS